MVMGTSLKDQKEVFTRNISWFLELKRVANEKKVEIINCAKRTSVLDVFPKIRTQEGLEK